MSETTDPSAATPTEPTGPTAPQRPGRGFGAVAATYDRGRPDYPVAAAAWVAGPHPVTVLEVGAGTGKLTAALAALGHDVHATDPDEAMLALLGERLPDVRRSVAAAEKLPLEDHSVDVVVGAQCFHWFDLERALPEIARVLRPGGRVAVVWAERDERIPWVRRLGRILHPGGGGQEPDWTERLLISGLFGFVEETSVPFWQSLDRNALRDLVLARSHVLDLSEDQQAERLDAALALYDGFDRGWEGLQLPYTARCLRAQVAAPRASAPEREPSAAEDDDVDPPTDDDSGTLLIDFR